MQLTTRTRFAVLAALRAISKDKSAPARLRMRAVEMLLEIERTPSGNETTLSPRNVNKLKALLGHKKETGLPASHVEKDKAA